MVVTGCGRRRIAAVEEGSRTMACFWRRKATRCGDRVVAACVMVLVATQWLCAQQPVERDTAAANLAMAHECGPQQCGSDVVIAWNHLTHDVAFAEDQFL